MELLDYIQKGGPIVYILTGLNIIGFTIMLWKLLILWTVRFRKKKIVARCIDFLKSTDEIFTHEALQNVLKREITALEYGLGAIKTIASVAPLLGLLGTVVGVLNAFDAISKHGLDDPSVFSGGISVALITTVAGLIVAIPHYMGYNYFISLLDRIELQLEKEIIEHADSCCLLKKAEGERR